jgi:hypothetical protein
VEVVDMDRILRQMPGVLFMDLKCMIVMRTMVWIRTKTTIRLWSANLIVG